MLPFQRTVTHVVSFPTRKVFSTFFHFKEYNSKKLSKKLDFCAILFMPWTDLYLAY